ncbi:MAG: thioredoxin family protein [Proteobacteria bacterium]|nr:thioredoxin family protein [Pseudomonadota bacterium]
MQKKQLLLIGGIMIVLFILHGISSYQFRRNISDWTNSVLGKPTRAEKKKLRTPSSHPMPVLIDVGSKGCAACTMMEPILDELDEEYTQSLRVEFIDMRKDSYAGNWHRIRVIPTQIFYDASGKEITRHMGTISKEQILEVFKKYGIEIKRDKELK